ncbi:MoaF-related domain-containing protein [Granulicella arctica]|uniref:MoaF-related domain-containing protein n=1 Tax=Granulicella arctica TaxID=940613 RepID=UPI0021E062AA|nr:hypothetical protein [Granulicella arctica]
MSAQEVFPAIGHRYLVDFQAFRVELFFESLSSMTYTGIDPDGKHDGSETVNITVQPVRDHLFLVTWQEADKTTVVHLEDYKDKTITTCITDPTGAFSKYHGTVTFIS